MEIGADEINIKYFKMREMRNSPFSTQSALTLGICMPPVTSRLQWSSDSLLCLSMLNVYKVSCWRE